VIPTPPGWAIDWPALEQALGGIMPSEELARTPQDPAFHGEGDVWTHTRLVVEALVGDPDWRALPAAERAIAFRAALLHDVGKPAATRHEPDGRIRSPGHSASGEQMVRVWLWRTGAPLFEREHICRLVRSHQVPFFAIDHQDANHIAELLSLRLRNDLLALVALADARGRRCAKPADRDRLIGQVELYRELSRELGVLDAPRAFASDHTRVLWSESRGRRPPDVAAHDDCASEVWVMSGLPASGKDAWLAAQKPQLSVISLDALRESLEVDPAEAQGTVVAAAREAAREALRAGRAFAWNATNLSDRVRSQVIQLARSYRARVHLVYCEVPPDVLAARNRARPNPVPATALDRMLERWSVPTPDEAHTVTYVTTA
jgi:predicted kinase